MKPLNIHKAVTDVETMGERDSKPRSFPKPFACWPCRKPSLNYWQDPWQCRHEAAVRAEQAEDTPRGNKANSPLKNPPQQNNIPLPLSLPRRGRAARRLRFVFVAMGNVKHSSCALLTAFIPLPSPFISLPRLQIKEQMSGVCAAVTVLEGREGRGCREQPRCPEPQHGPAERGAAAGAGQGDEHPGLCRVLAHESLCDGAERASPSRHLGDRSHSGEGLWRRVLAGAGWVWDGVGYRLICPQGRKILMLPQAPRQLWEEKPG